jgi:hypothetical protein
MRISSYNLSVPLTRVVARREAELLVREPCGLSARYPDQRRLGPEAIRVVEGELLRPATPADALLAEYRAATLHAQARRIDASVPSTGEVSGLQTSQALFYELHSSSENLAASALGRAVNQFV